MRRRPINPPAAAPAAALRKHPPFSIAYGRPSIRLDTRRKAGRRISWRRTAGRRKAGRRTAGRRKAWRRLPRRAPVTSSTQPIRATRWRFSSARGPPARLHGGQDQRALAIGGQERGCVKAYFWSRRPRGEKIPFYYSLEVVPREVHLVSNQVHVVHVVKLA